MVAIIPNKALSEALAEAKKVAQEGVVIKHSELDAKYTALLRKTGWLTPVIRGWTLLNKPESTESGASTIWFVGFWPFLKCYLNDRFGKQNYCLSADASMDLHVGEEQIARQIAVITQKSSNQRIDLPFETSLMLYWDAKNYPKYRTNVNGIYVMTLPSALCRLSPSYFKNKPLNVEIALKMISSASEISRILLEDGLVTDAGRIAGALRAIGEPKKADQIVSDMQAAGFVIVETNPFEEHKPVLSDLPKIVSPNAGRIQALWRLMREDVIEVFPTPPGVAPSEEKKFISVIMDRYRQDAYHSLSIEGYEVTEDLIHKIATGEWSPESKVKDRDQINAMAARGYFKAFQVVMKSVSKVIKNGHPGKVFEDDLQTWYRELFSPSVQVGLLKAGDLAGYRNGPVFIKGARHVPPRAAAVEGAMETLFQLLQEEKHPAVRAVLGHFILAYVHPYFDGNGRIARFLLNLMLVSGGYDWTVIRAERRSTYMSALEQASTESNIVPFAKFVKSELDYWRKHGFKGSGKPSLS